MRLQQKRDQQRHRANAAREEAELRRTAPSSREGLTATAAQFELVLQQVALGLVSRPLDQHAAVVTSRRGSDTGFRDQRPRRCFRCLGPRVREIKIRINCELATARPGVTPSTMPTTLRPQMPRPRSRTELFGSICTTRCSVS